jgi:hypothetical protein
MIHRYLDCSTAHLTEATMDALSADQVEGVVAMPYPPYGVFVSIPDDEDVEIPEDLRQVLAFARANDCLLIRFDHDGDDVDLPVYDWEPRWFRE